MSSLDSVLNSLSAVTMEDFVKRNKKFKNFTKTKDLLVSRLLTFFWGLVSIILAFFVENISNNVLIAINKISSLVNGPIIGVFLLGIFTRNIKVR